MSQTARSINIAGAEAPDDQALLARFAPALHRIADGALARERDGQHPAEAAQWLRESGFTALRVPRALGACAVVASGDDGRHWRNVRTLASHNPLIYRGVRWLARVMLKP